MTRKIRIGSLVMDMATQPEPAKPKRTRKPKAAAPAPTPVPDSVVLEGFDDPLT